MWGGRTAAVLRSFVVSCQRAKVDPFAWFQDFLSRIGTHPINRFQSFCLTTGLPLRFISRRVVDASSPGDSQPLTSNGH
jgi:hypothetical protein